MWSDQWWWWCCCCIEHKLNTKHEHRPLPLYPDICTKFLCCRRIFMIGKNGLVAQMLRTVVLYIYIYGCSHGIKILNENLYHWLCATPIIIYQRAYTNDGTTREWESSGYENMHRMLFIYFLLSACVHVEWNSPHSITKRLRRQQQKDDKHKIQSVMNDKGNLDIFFFFSQC